MNGYISMKKLLPAFALLLSVIHSKAQLFDWQMATHSGFPIELCKKIAVLKDESVVTAFSPKYRDYRSSEVNEMKDYIDCANGTSIEFNPEYKHHAVIANITKNGTINWKQELFARGERYFEILHISSDEALNSYVLLGSYEIPGVNDYPLIYIPQGKLFYPICSDEEAVDIVLTYDIDISKYCNNCLAEDYKINFDINALGSYWLIKIDAKGKIRWIKNSPEALDNLISHAYCFESSADGALYFITDDDEPHFEKEIKKRRIKDQYLLARLDTGFYVNWSTKIISSSKKGDYTRASGDPLLTLDESGNLIAYLNYEEYLTIENEEYTSKKRKEHKNKTKEGGSFIAIFDSAGKLKTAKNSKSAFRLEDMAARNNVLYLPITNLRHDRVFNEKIDTGNLLQSVLICLDYQGKLLRKKMEYNVQYRNIEISKNETLYLMTGPAKNRSKKEDRVDFYTPLFKTNNVKNADDVYVFMYDKTGAELKMKTITEKRAWQYYFNFDFKVINEHYSLMFGEADYGCVRELKEYTNNFKKGKGCNSIGFWCKLKL